MTAYKNRALAVDAIISHNDAVLLIKRKNDPFQDFWALPGGYVDFNEEVPDAVKREVFEETGLKTTSLKFFGVYSDPKRDPRQNISLVYMVRTEGTAKAGDDAKECTWFAVNNLPGKLAFDHAQIIGNYIKNYL